MSISKSTSSSMLVISTLLVAVIVTGCSSPLTDNKPLRMTEGTALNENSVTIFQPTTWGCCKAWSGYLKEQGFQVETVYTEDMTSIKQKYQIPQDMTSCHTAVIGDYFVEGHVPVKAIEKMLEEKPAINGIALPGMPPGSPGMPGEKTEAFKIYALLDGAKSEFMIISE